MTRLVEEIAAVMIFGAACLSANANPVECGQPGLTTTFEIGGGIKESGTMKLCSENVFGVASRPVSFSEHESFQMDTSGSAPTGGIQLAAGRIGFNEPGPSSVALSTRHDDLAESFIGSINGTGESLLDFSRDDSLVQTPEPRGCVVVLLGLGMVGLLLRRRDLTT